MVSRAVHQNTNAATQLYIMPRPVSWVGAAVGVGLVISTTMGASVRLGASPLPDGVEGVWEGKCNVTVMGTLGNVHTTFAMQKLSDGTGYVSIQLSHCSVHAPL